MTPKDAREHIIEDGVCRGVGDCVCVEALKIAADALKKQIPKKPRETDAYPHRVYCAECAFTLAFNKENMDFIKSNQMYNYCPACGQALDWGKESDQ